MLGRSLMPDAEYCAARHMDCPLRVPFGPRFRGNDEGNPSFPHPAERGERVFGVGASPGSRLPLSRPDSFPSSVGSNSFDKAIHSTFTDQAIWDTMLLGLVG